MLLLLFLKLVLLVSVDRAGSTKELNLPRQSEAAVYHLRLHDFNCSLGSSIIMIKLIGVSAGCGVSSNC